MKRNVVLVALVLACLFVGTSAFAVTINPGYGGPGVNDGSVEPSLWNGLVPNYSKGEINNPSNQILNTYWASDTIAPGVTDGVLFLQFQYTSGAPDTPYNWTDENGIARSSAGDSNSQSNELGIFQVGNTANKVKFLGQSMFTGVNAGYSPKQGDKMSLIFFGDHVNVQYAKDFGTNTIYNSNSVFAGYNFGFYVNNFYSITDFNNDGNKDHVVGFKAQNGNVGYYIGFEDGTDFDFQDHVLYAESIRPVPEPGTMMLLGSGLVGLAGWGRKKFRK